MQSNDVEKVYYARVIGNFKESQGDHVTIDKWMYCISNKDTLHSCAPYD
jgi:23S rRNA-/tRNA-specific pseudouridylate synthase